MEAKVFAALVILIPLGIVFVLDCIFKLVEMKHHLKSDGWKKVREEGDFDVYVKTPWYSNKPFELYILREDGKTVLFRGAEKEKQKDEKECFDE